MTVKFEAGKKYRNNLSGRVSTFLAYTSDSKAVMEFSCGNISTVTIPYFNNWDEYKEPKRGTVWVNIYKMNSSPAYNDREMADRYALEGRLACIEVPWVEGQGL